MVQFVSNVLWTRGCDPQSKGRRQMLQLSSQGRLNSPSSSAGAGQDIGRLDGATHAAKTICSSQCINPSLISTQIPSQKSPEIRLQQMSWHLGTTQANDHRGPKERAEMSSVVWWAGVPLGALHLNWASSFPNTGSLSCRKHLLQFSAEAE